MIDREVGTVNKVLAGKLSENAGRAVPPVDDRVADVGRAQRIIRPRSPISHNPAASGLWGMASRQMLESAGRALQNGNLMSTDRNNAADSKIRRFPVPRG